MIVICITICIIVAFICATICFVTREKVCAVTDLSEQRLLEDINIRVLNVYNMYLDDYNKALSEGSSFYINGKEFFHAFEDILQMTIDYKQKEED